MESKGYVYDQGWQEERARLAGMEALWDAGTGALLAAAGARPGAACLEVGAGGGSIAEWLADQVGPEGRVVAADVDTRFVEPLASDVLEVQRLDITADDLPAAAFDVIHARLVLEHLPERATALDRMLAALRPGGHLVIEDYDWTSFGFDSGDDVDRAGAEGILGFMASAGFDATYGRRVVGDLAERGLDVRGEGRLYAIDPSHPGFAFFKLSFSALAPRVVEAGAMDAAVAEEVTRRLEQPDRRLITPTMMAAIGRKPE